MKRQQQNEVLLESLELPLLSLEPVNPVSLVVVENDSPIYLEGGLSELSALMAKPESVLLTMEMPSEQFEMRFSPPAL
jgi:hypothetical protein